MPEILDEDADLLLAGHRDIFLVIWRRSPTAPALVRMAAELNAFASRHQNSVAMLVVVEPGTTMPEASVRARMARDMKRHESFTRAMALVYEAEGFMAATVRAVAGGLQALSGQVVPTHMFATVEQAAEWLSRPGVAGPLVPSELKEAVAGLRAGRGLERAQADLPPHTSTRSRNRGPPG